MAVNNFLPFAGGAGANVLTQDAYLALSSLRSNGFSAGTAQSAQLNKVWRQASIMAAVIGQLIVDSTGLDALDDGSTAALVANLKASIKAQSNGVVGTSRNVVMSVAAESASATLTADEVIVESALGVLAYRLANVNRTINLGTIGAGGMDTGTAPANGFVGIYLIYNPVSGASALLAVNATSVAAPSIYGGANMPSGYTASALVSVAPISVIAGQFAPFLQIDRAVDYAGISVLTGSSAVTANTPRTSTGIPLNAKAVSGFNQIGSALASAVSQQLCSTSNNALGGQFNTQNVAAGSSCAIPFRLILSVPQTIYQTSANSAGTPSFTISVKNYEF
ncbi:hypothetical protein [Pseudomonas sp. C9-3]|uniref:hypothetical protein n=1 Tax=Pseudomonas sp. C9-3 TaxID=3078264 RepID=UPI0028EAFD1B|nr:hypothetical protein [Pseudomonas sp. C9-3]